MEENKNNKEAYLSLSEAAAKSPYSQEYLSLRARQGKLRAVKLGKTWFTTHAWLQEYLGSVSVANRNEYRQISTNIAPTFSWVRFAILSLILAGLVTVNRSTLYLGYQELRSATQVATNEFLSRMGSPVRIEERPLVFDGQVLGARETRGGEIGAEVGASLADTFDQVSGFSRSVVQYFDIDIEEKKELRRRVGALEENPPTVQVVESVQTVPDTSTSAATEQFERLTVRRLTVRDFLYSIGPVVLDRTLTVGDIAEFRSDLRVLGFTILQGAEINGDLTVFGNLIPGVSATSDIGSPIRRFRDIYLSGSVFSPGGTASFSSGSFDSLAVTTFDEGSVLFAGPGGQISEDNPNFFWDDGNNRLGLGVSAPSARLHVLQNASVPALLVRQDGTGRLFDFQDSGTSVLYKDDGAPITINSSLNVRDSGSPVMTITDTGSGSVGTGATLPLTLVGTTLNAGNNNATTVLRIAVNQDPAVPVFGINGFFQSGIYKAEFDVYNGTIAGRSPIAYLDASLMLWNPELKNTDFVIRGQANNVFVVDASENAASIGTTGIGGLGVSSGVSLSIHPFATAPSGATSMTSSLFTTTGSVDVSNLNGNFYANQFTYNTLTATSAKTIPAAATVVITDPIQAGTNVTITNPYALWVAAGASRFDGNLSIQGNTTIGDASTDTVVFNASLASHLIPNSNNIYDLGSTAFFMRNVYTNTLVANNISAGGTNIAGTTAETFTLNSDNATADLEDSSYIFFRGTVTPNAIIRWNSSLDRIEANQDLRIKDETPTTGATQLIVTAGAGQGSTDLVQIQNNAGSNLIRVDSSGNVAINAATASGNLDIRQIANGNQVLYARRNTDVSPTGNFIQFQNAAGTSTLFSVDINGNVTASGSGSFTGNLNPAADNTYDLGTTALRWRKLNVGPGSVDLSSTTGTAGAGANYTLGQFSFSGTTLKVATSAVGTGSVGTIQVTTGANVGLNVDGVGNVGIGTTNPNGGILHVQAAGTSAGTYENIAVFGKSDTSRTGVLFQSIAGVARVASDWRTSGANTDLILSSVNSVGTYQNQLSLQASSGNVGIGTTGPISRLDVKSSGTDTIPLRVTGSADADPLLRVNEDVASGDASLYLFKDTAVGTTAQTVQIHSDGTSYFNGGNVGIGTTNPQTVNGLGPGGTILQVANTAGRASLIAHSSADAFLSLVDTGAPADNKEFRVISDGGVMTFAKVVDTGGQIDLMSILGSSGKVGIGTVTPLEKLEVTGGVRLGLAPATLTTLSVAMLSTDTTATVVSTTGYPSAGTLLIDSEAMTYTGTTATTFTGLGRGALGTPAAAHSLGATVNNYLFTSLATATTPKMVVTGSGNVGIGTTGPLNKLVVQSGNADGMILNNSAGAARAKLFLDSAGNTDLQLFNAAGTLNVLLDANSGGPSYINAGNVGIGTAGPGGILDVRGGTAASGAGTGLFLTAQAGGASSNGGNVIINSGPNGAGGLNGNIIFATGGTITTTAPGSTTIERMRIDATGNVGIGTAGPGRLLDITIPFAKTDTTIRGVAFLGKSNESANFSALKLEMQGGAAQANRWWGIQTIESGLSVAGSLVFQNEGGNVGIGTTGPTSLLHLNAPTELIKGDAAGATRFRLSHSGGGDISIENPSAANMLFLTGAAERMRITSTGNVGINSLFATTGEVTICSTTTILVKRSAACTGSDLPEFYPVTNDVEPGDVVSITNIPNSIPDEYALFLAAKSQAPYDNKILGVMSSINEVEAPGEGQRKAEHYHLLALAGRVLVKASAENGAIAPGDVLTSASIPGHAMKATKPGRAIGIALSGLSSGTGTVMVFVNPHWYSPEVAGQTTANGPQTTADASYTTLTTGTLTVTGTATFKGKATFEDAADFLGNVIASRDVEVRGKLTVRDAVTFEKNLTVKGDLIVEGNLNVAGKIAGSSSTRGKVTIPSGESQVVVTFPTSYATAPQVVATPRASLGGASFWVDGESETGFTVHLSAPTATPVEFTWIAIE